jgi:hypothetical protein
LVDFAMRAGKEFSVPCSLVSTVTMVCFITSGSRPRSKPASGARSRENSKHCVNHQDSLAARQAVRVAGAPSAAANGNPSIQKLLWKLPTIILPAVDSGTELRCYAGVWTNRHANARWIKSRVGRGNRFRCCSIVVPTEVEESRGESKGNSMGSFDFAQDERRNHRDQLGSVILPRPSTTLFF